MSFSAPQSGAAIAFEGTYGTPATTGFFLPALNASVSANTTKRMEEIKRIGTLARDNFSPPIIYEVSGDISGMFSNIWLAKSWYNITTSGASPPYTHDFSTLKNTLTSFTLVNHFGQFAGCILASLNVSVRANELAQVRFGIVSGHKPASGSITVSAPDSNVDTAFPYYTASITSASYDVTDIREASLTIDITNELVRVLGSQNPTTPIHLQFTPKFEFRALFDNVTQFNNFLNDVRAGLTFTLSTGTGASLREVSFTLGSCVITSYNYSVAPNSIIEGQLALEALTCTIVAKNARATPP